MKTLNLLAAALMAVVCGCGRNQSEAMTTIVTDVPERPSDQTDMVAFAAEKIDTVRVGFIGLGMRGPSAVERFTHIPGTKIVALCDIEPDRVDSTQKILERAGLPQAAGYSGSADAWKELCERPDIDLVYVVTDWLNHAPMGIYAMEAWQACGHRGAGRYDSRRDMGADQHFGAHTPPLHAA